MNNYDLHVAALARYYQNIGCSEGAALRAAYEDADALREGKSISPEALAAIPDPVGKGLASSINFTEDAGMRQTRAQMNKYNETQFKLHELASEVIFTINPDHGLISQTMEARGSEKAILRKKIHPRFRDGLSALQKFI